MTEKYSIIRFMSLVAIFAMVASAGCITYAKETVAEITATPVPTPVPTANVTVEEYIPPTIPPTPEPTLSLDQIMEQTGGLHMGTLLSFQRDNVSGYKDLGGHVTVYGWKMLNSVKWHSVSWGRDFRQGAGDGKKFLFIYALSWSDEGSARMYGVQPSQFVVQINETLYYPTSELLPEIRITDFDEVWNFRHTEGIKPYGYLRVNKGGVDTVESPLFLKAGFSNAWDGYIPYAVPLDTKPEDVRVIVNMHDLVESHWWNLE